MISYRKNINFYTLQDHCGERKFNPMKEKLKYYVSCHLGPDKCNAAVCPVWASIDAATQEKIPEPPITINTTLRDINTRLKNNIENVKVLDTIPRIKRRNQSMITGFTGIIGETSTTREEPAIIPFNGRND